MGNSCRGGSRQNDDGSLEDDILESTGSHEFTTERLTEESLIIWKIKNFALLQEIKCPKKESLTSPSFSAGKRINQVSTWKFGVCFKSTKRMGIHLMLEESFKLQKTIYARYFLSVKDPRSHKQNIVSTAVDGYTRGNGWEKFVSLDKLKRVGALTQDTLTLQIKIVIYGDEMAKIEPLSIPLSSQQILKLNAINQIAKHFPNLLETGECSDFVIRVKKCDSQEYFERKVHRMILSARSPVFLAMLNSPMSEKEKGIVTIEDLTPKGLDVLLKFIYTGSLPLDWKLVPEEIVNATEKYQFPLLRSYWEEWLHTACTTENAFPLFHLAKQHGLSNASSNILKYIKTNLENTLSKAEKFT